MMVSKKSITTVVASFLVLGFLFLALPQSSNAQEIEIGCCQYGVESGEPRCLTTGFTSCPRPLPGSSFDGFFPEDDCNQETGFCTGFVREVPTLSEWGLIAMAGVLGVVGFMVMRRKRATA